MVEQRTAPVSYGGRVYSYDTPRFTRQMPLAGALRYCCMGESPRQVSELRARYENQDPQNAAVEAMVDRVHEQGLLANIGVVHPHQAVEKPFGDQHSLDIADVLSAFQVDGQTFYVGVNINRTLDSQTYTTLDGRIVPVLYPDFVLPQAEDAYRLYATSRHDPNARSIYDENDPHIVHAVNRLRKAKPRFGPGTIRVMGVNEGMVGRVLEIGLEHQEYAKWKKFSKVGYVSAAVHARAKTYLFKEWVGVKLLEHQLIAPTAFYIPPLAEIAYGPIPLARLGEFVHCEPGLVEKLLTKLNVTDTLHLLLVDRNRIILTARTLIANMVRELGSGLEAVLQTASIVSALRQLDNNLLSLKPFNLKGECDDPDGGGAHSKGNPKRSKPAQPNTAGTMPKELHPHTQMNPALSGDTNSKPNPQLATPCSLAHIRSPSSKPPKDRFVFHYRVAFRGGAADLLGTFYEIATPKELNYLMESDPRNGGSEKLLRSMQKYSAALRRAGFDMDLVTGDVRSPRLAGAEASL